MQDETRQLLEELTERIIVQHAAGRRDLQRVLDSSTAAGLLLGADGGEDCKAMARLLRALLVGARDVFQELKRMEDRARELGQTEEADVFGRMWGNPHLGTEDKQQ